MNKRLLAVFIAVISMTFFSACSGYKERTLDYLGKRPTTGPFFTEDKTPLVDLNYEAADKMADLLTQRLPVGSPITVKIFKLRNNPLVTDFARITTEQIASRIAQKGFDVVADDSNYPTKAEDKDMPNPIKCILTGAYTVGPQVIFLTAAVTTVEDGEIIASWDWTVPLNRNTKSLLPYDKEEKLAPIVNTSEPYKKAEYQNQKSKNPQPTSNYSVEPGFEQNIVN